MPLDQKDFVTKEACEMHRHQVTKLVEGIMLRQEKQGDAIDDLKLNDREQFTTLKHVGESIDTLNSLMKEISEKIIHVDKDSSVSSAVTQQAVKFNIDLNWKTISAIGFILTIVLQIFFK